MPFKTNQKIDAINDDAQNGLRTPKSRVEAAKDPTPAGSSTPAENSTNGVKDEDLNLESPINPICLAAGLSTPGESDKTVDVEVTIEATGSKDPGNQEM